MTSKVYEFPRGKPRNITGKQAEAICVLYILDD